MAFLQVTNNNFALQVAKRRWLRRTGLFQLPQQAWVGHQGHRLYLDLSDWAGPSYHVTNWGVETYESQVAATIMKVFPESGVFFDIGANIGIFSFLIAANKRPQKIYAFEPEPRSFACISKTRQANGWESVMTASPTALSSEKGEITFYVTEKNAGGHSINRQGVADENLEVAQEIKVNSTTLDLFCQEKSVERIDLMKIDVQRHESHVLAGAAESLKKYRPIVAMETYRDDLKSLIEPFKDLEYQIYLPEMGPMPLNYEQVLAQFNKSYLDLFFVPSEKLSLFES